MRPARIACVFLASSLVTVIAGCGGKGSVSGTVTYDGQPVDGGAISFTPAGSKDPAGSARIVGGKYSVPGSDKLTPGTYKVQINWLKGTGKKIKNPTDPGSEIEETVEAIPVEYNIGSKLTAEIGSGSSTANFDLKAGNLPPPPTGPNPGPAGGGPKQGGGKKKSAGDT